MDLIFNELSVQSLATNRAEGFNRVSLFLETFKRAKEKNYNKIRFETPNETGDILEGISITSELTLADYRKIYLNDNSNRRYGQLLLGLPKRPYLDDNSDEANRYILNTFSLEKEEKVVNPFGLASAYLLSNPAIGFCSEPFWENFKFKILIKGELEKSDFVFCCSMPNHFDIFEFSEFIEGRLPIDLSECMTNPEKKPISLRDDHGKDVLKLFSKKILNSPYIVSIVNSLPYNSSEKKFIRKVYANGLIEIVLTNTDEGFGIVVKTTGKNKLETEAIAKIIEEKYKP